MLIDQVTVPAGERGDLQKQEGSMRAGCAPTYKGWLRERHRNVQSRRQRMEGLLENRQG